MKIVTHAASDFKHEHCTTYTMHSFSRGYTKWMIKEIETMARLAGKVSKLRNKVKERNGVIQHNRSKHMSFEMLKKGEWEGWVANDCLYFTKMMPLIHNYIDEIFKHETNDSYNV